MASRISTRIKEAMLQYSKKMCTRVTIFWMLYRLANFIVALIRPEIANALVELSAGVDTIMIVNMGTYTFNSSSEKISVAFATRKALYGNDNTKKDNNESDDEEDNG